ncbi:hypothetical protein [Planotetraspora kaengkrachanensis]|uniref:Uncharacterized protein n=1 Tax=Planotetraspora kaengkrachanensis TaxID=575193 RepID=A0A8J3LWA2_9ACTN|nr:hypothetical protein [Planotetraspora kaengkrachanensis]GIG77930.1 hypothetical protein Pka01_10570 [Planotetraspora kaengkrachanensis]
MSSGNVEPEDGDDRPAGKPVPPPETAPSGDPPPDAQAAKAPARKRPRLTWEAVGGITAIAGLVAAVVFGVLQVAAPSQQAEPTRGAPSAPGVPADERLELVDLSPSREPVDVPVSQYESDGRTTAPSAGSTVPGGDSRERRALVVTLRNSAGDTALLTGVKLVVHSTFEPSTCEGGAGEGVKATLNYDFRFPETLQVPWAHTEPQVFAVRPHDADALSITMGPEKEEGLTLMWRFSVYGVSKGGKEAYWGDGVWTDYYELSDADYARYVRGDSPKPVDDEVRACAAQVLSGLKNFTAGSSLVVHPGVTAMIDYYRRLAES